jgi:hypothetical protein
MAKALALFALGGIASFALAQPATLAQRAGVPSEPGLATLHLRTNIGSFRLIDGFGRVEISFAGTMLINQLRGFGQGPGQLQVLGNLRREYEANDRVVLFGRGRVVIVGRWRGIQWFGTDMRATWFGRGLARIAGEFDQNLDTGEFWYDDPTKKFPWGATGTLTILLPDTYAPQVTPRERRQPAPRS